MLSQARDDVMRSYSQRDMMIRFYLDASKSKDARDDLIT